tara:strand:- start:10012 stop:10527 length:516 start_codon:yes stop_codon:yes gene_type:complete
MTRVVFNTEINLGNLESFKLLPNELQGNIADYTEEGYNQKCFNYDWYDIIKTIGYRYCYDYLIDFLNKHMTNRIIGPLKITDCKNMTGYCHPCYKFITCDEKREVGFYYDYLKMPGGGRKYIWEEDMIKSEKATQLIIDKINDYIHSDSYDSSIMYKINKRLLDDYDKLTN